MKTLIDLATILLTPSSKINFDCGNSDTRYSVNSEYIGNRDK